jgi:energy-coupling factor transporter ATP-binding protein EcfA2
MTESARAHRNGESQLLPEQVFTPTGAPAREVFTRRNESDLLGNPALQDSLREALCERGRQVVLYGDSGVGKSTLLKYAAEDEGMPVLSVQAISGRTFDELVDTAIREVTIERDVEIERSGARGASLEAGVTQPITIKGQLKGEKGQKVRIEVIERTPLLALLETMQTDRYRILAFENFHNVDASERQAFAQAMEVVSDRAPETGDIKVVIIGVADDAASLLATSASVRRRTTQIGVPRMPDDEILNILRNGFALLGLTAQGDTLTQLIFYCDGFPYFAHLLGLAVARFVARSGVSIIDQKAVDAALVRVAKEVEASFQERITRAIETGGEVQPRHRILGVLTRSDKREWRGAEVIDEYYKSFTRKIGSTDGFLHAALGQLVKPRYGSVLTRSGTRGHYVYRFNDPYLRPYLRMAHFPRQTRSLF